MQSRRNRNAAPNQYSNQINALTEEGAGGILLYSRGGLPLAIPPLPPSNPSKTHTKLKIPNTKPEQHLACFQASRNQSRDEVFYSCCAPSKTHLQMDTQTHQMGPGSQITLLGQCAFRIPSVFLPDILPDGLDSFGGAGGVSEI